MNIKPKALDYIIFDVNIIRKLNKLTISIMRENWKIDTRIMEILTYNSANPHIMKLIEVNSEVIPQLDCLLPAGKFY